MTTHKLKLKRTPEEEAQRKLRKEQKREKKRKRKESEYGYAAGSSSSKRAHLESPNRGDRASYTERKWASSDEDEDEYGPQPAPSASSSTAYGKDPDYEAMKAEMEEKLFREKMFDAMGEDERLDGVEANFNDYVHVPDRWKTASSSTAKTRIDFEGDDFLKLDPSTLDEEEYVEWIRAGMYRKTHAEEYAEQQRKKAAKAARQAEEKARKAEAARLEKILEDERKLRKLERDSRKLDYAREDYNARWAALLAPPSATMVELGFNDIPWPIASAHHEKAPKRKDNSERLRRPIALEDLTAEAIASFLLPPSLHSTDKGEVDAAKKKDRKDKLRDAFLRFHPDKFEGRFMKKIKEEEKEKVREAIGQVSRVLNSLMGDGG